MRTFRFGVSNKRIPIHPQVPEPNRLRPQLFAGKYNNGDIYECRQLPQELWTKLKNATYMGCGLTTDVWDLHDGTVLKITKDEAAIKIANYLQSKPTPGLPKVVNVLNNRAKFLGYQEAKEWTQNKKLKDYTIIIQEKYEPLPDQQWDDICTALRHIDLSSEPQRWARSSDGEPARGKEGEDIAWSLAVTTRKIKNTDPHHPLATCTVAMTTLHTWLKTKTLGAKAGIDLDHQDNWAVDKNGNPILLDPIYTAKTIIPE